MEIFFVFGNNTDEQIVKSDKLSTHGCRRCLLPTKIPMVRHDTAATGSKSRHPSRYAAEGRVPVPVSKYEEENPDKSSKDRHYHANMSSTRTQTINPVISWTNLMFVIDGILTIVGWQNDKSKSVYTSTQYDITDLSASWKRTCFTSSDGNCYIWENEGWDSKPKQVMKTNDDDSLTFTAVQSGERHTVITTGEGDIGTVEASENGDLIYKTLVTKLKVKQVSCGKEHVLILTRIGEVYSYGGGSRGQLGHGATDSSHEIRVVEALEGVTMVTIASGGWHSTAVSDAGDLYVWGWNESGQLGLPCAQIHKQNKSEVSHCCQCSSGDRKCEYVNILTLPTPLDFELCPQCRSIYKELKEAQCGKNSACDDDETQSAEVNISKVACGSRHTIAMTEDGLVYTWGWNGHGQLGHGDIISRDTPTLLRTLHSVHNVTTYDVKAGYWNSLVMAK